MEIYLYNTLTHSKEKFKPIDGKEIKIYSCGPTVYSYAHIGNFRTYVFVDSLRRMFKYNGKNLKHVMNITDVGHLTSDADTGEDKMEKAAKKEGKDPYEIANFYTKTFMEDMKKLNIDMPNIISKATENIPEMLQMVKDIIDRGYAYETSKGIYFDVSKLDKYPVLSNNKVDDEEHGARIDVDPEKKNPYDFAIWIKAPENHIMKWDSPWGKSYPGWHLECSAMSKKFLGDNFDIHTGGIDHVSIHHENEIAQSKGATGKIPANYWLHTEFLLVDGGKMSKSLGNIYTLEELEKKGIDPLAYKLFCFTSHYRNKLNFTFEGVKASGKALSRLREGYKKHNEGKEDVDEDILANYEERFHNAINDDLNMPLAMGIVWEVINQSNKSMKYAKLLEKFDEVLGLKIKEIKQEEVVIPEEIKELIEERNLARQNKDWSKSDEIRDKIQKIGYIVKDTQNGTMVEKL